MLWAAFSACQPVVTVYDRDDRALVRLESDGRILNLSRGEPLAELDGVRLASNGVRTLAVQHPSPVPQSRDSDRIERTLGGGLRLAGKDLELRPDGSLWCSDRPCGRVVPAITPDERAAAVILSALAAQPHRGVEVGLRVDGVGLRVDEVAVNVAALRDGTLAEHLPCRPFDPAEECAGRILGRWTETRVELDGVGGLIAVDPRTCGFLLFDARVEPNLPGRAPSPFSDDDVQIDATDFSPDGWPSGSTVGIALRAARDVDLDCAHPDLRAALAAAAVLASLPRSAD
jgi:hypothetical protein